VIKLFLNLFVLLSGTLNYLFLRKKWLLSLFNGGKKSVNLCSGLLTMSLKSFVVNSCLLSYSDGVFVFLNASLKC
jgi:hypothetical protein